MATSALGLSIASAHEPIGENHAYVVGSDGKVVRDGSGNCVRTSSWVEEHALVECGDAVAQVEPEPEPEPDPAPPAFERVTLQAETLFGFDRDELRPEGQAELDDLIQAMREAPEVEEVLATGHTDFIGSEAYNQELSERRVTAVKEYMVSEGLNPDRIRTAAMGESQPVVECSGLRGDALVECLQPNRRVEVEVSVQRETQSGS